MAFYAKGLLRGLQPYYDNPTAKRDLRSQLRGNKALWLWSLYLLLLTAVAYFVYDGIQYGGQSMPVAEIQGRLQTFYQTMMTWLAAIICVITPALTAGTIPVERQRRSLDLLFSAPVSMKGLLVGKMISSYRYLWMLLVLSLPITSVCVVMGGASWSDVLASYAILSFAGIIMTSIGLLISCLVTSMAAAVLWSYLCVAGYLILSAGFVASGVYSHFGGDPTVAPWYVGMNPFFVYQSAPTHCILFGQNVPNWIPAGLIALVFSRLALLGAGSALSYHKSPETRKLRVYGLVYLFALSLFISWGLNNIGAMSRGLATAGFIGWTTVAFFFFMPILYSYGKDGANKYRNDGLFNWRNTFWSNPSGSLPYTFLIWAAVAGGALAGQAFAGSYISPTFVPFGKGQEMLPYYMALWSICYFFMWWCIGRLVSSRTSTLKNARVGFIGVMILLIALPAPFISILNTVVNPYTGDSYSLFAGAWVAHIWYPMTSAAAMALSPLYAVVMLLLGGLALSLQQKKEHE